MIEIPRGLFEAYPEDVRPRTLPVPLGNAGGYSGARLWRYTSGRGPLALRAWPAEGVGPAQLRPIHACLAAAAALPFVTVPVADRSGRTFQQASGRLWEITPWMPGSPDPGRPPTRAHLRAALAGLAAFHEAMEVFRVEPSASTDLRNRLADVRKLRAGGLAELRELLARQPRDELRERAERWVTLVEPKLAGVEAVLATWSRTPLPRIPCVRDARPPHFLFEGDRLTGLVDFGAMGVDAVSGDLARLLEEWVGPDPVKRADALAAYEAVRPLEPIELKAIPAFERSMVVLLGERWTRWHFREGRVFDDPRAVADGLDRAVARLREQDAGGLVMP